MKVAILFPGYSNQYVGMGKELYDSSRLVQEYFEEASNCLDVNFVKLCFASSDIEMGKMGNAYTSLFLVNNSVYALLKERGITPDIFCGYNDGEFSALCAAGSISFPDGLYLLNKYCVLYQDFFKNSDIAFISLKGKNAQETKQLCTQLQGNNFPIEIGMYLGSLEHVLVGPRESIEQVRVLVVDQKGVSIDLVDNEQGIHASFAQKLVDEYKMYLEKVDFKDISIAIFSSIIGTEVQSGAIIKDLFLKHMTNSLSFVKVLAHLYLYDVVVLPIKAKKLSKQIQSMYPNMQQVTIQTMSDIELLQTSLSE